MIISFLVKPKARKTAILKQLDERSFSIALHAAPLEGAANDELVRFLAKSLRISQSAIVIKRGHRSRQKIVEMPDSANLSRLFAT